jgi:predicted metal-binding membrane protein
MQAVPATTRTAATAIALTTTTVLAAGSWIVVVRQMSGMDMGVATELGPLGSFLGRWVPMMAAMMLPGAIPAVLRHVRDGDRGPAGPLFVAAYLAVWTLVGVVLHAVYQPHETVTAGVVVLAAGVYELTPLKRDFRRRCREHVRSGFGYGMCCAGSSLGLMLIPVALGVMNLAWMAVITVVVTAQKLLPAKTAVDAAQAVLIAALGALILVAPSSVPGLTSSMSSSMTHSHTENTDGKETRQ